MKQNNLLKAAIYYQAKGCSVIPIRTDSKKPLVKWERYQKEPASADQIRKWWRQWPKANIGIVTGEVSNLTVIDADTEEGLNNLNDNFLPESLNIPTVKSPKPFGHHFWAEYTPGIPNRSNLLPGIDVRNDGG